MRRVFVDNRRFFCLALLLLCAARGGFAQSQRPMAGTFFIPARIQPARERTNPNCKEWESTVCKVCRIEAAIDISVKNKTMTPILLCRDMKPGPARVLMVTH